MDLLEILKQFKNIRPDAQYVKSSREKILFSGENLKGREVFAMPSWRMVLRFAESGFAIVLTGALLFLVAGGFSSFGKPIGVAGLDPAGLKAEAEAIDIQIQLLGLDYESVVNAGVEAGNESPISGVVKKATRAIGVLDESDSTEGLMFDAAIDGALDFLAE